MHNHQLASEDLFTLEAYAKARPAFRARVLEHKSHRRLAIGEHVTLQFEDRLTIQYQVQEMLRIERIFEQAGIMEELDSYNPLIPDGANWKATMLIEYPDPEERRVALQALVGIENLVWVQVAGHARVNAIADEDMDRSREEKTAAVHFLRFQLDSAMIEALRNGAVLGAGISHPAYTVAHGAVPDGLRESLLADLD